MATNLFRPVPAGAVNCAPTTSSQRVALTRPRKGASLRVKNTGSVRVFYELGNSSVAALVASSIPLDPGETEMLRLDEQTHIAGITSSGTGSLHAITGDGE